MYVKLRYKKNRFEYVMMAIYALTSMHVIFMQKTESFIIPYYIRQILVGCTFVVLLMDIFFHQAFIQLGKNKMIVFLFIILYLYRGWRHDDSFSFMTIQSIVTLSILLIFFQFETEAVKCIYEIFINIYVTLNVIGIILSLLRLVGIDLFWGNIYPSQNNDIYHHYIYSFLAVLCDEGRSYFRYCSIYNEPGVVGTVSALILCSRKYKINDKKNIILIIAGIMSMSTAFFVLSGLYIILKYISEKDIIKNVIIITLLCFSFIFADSILYQNNESYSRYVHDKIINFVAYGESNRSTSAMNKEFNNFLKQRKEILLGKGADARGVLVSNLTIKREIYQYGFMGLFLVFAAYFAIFHSVYEKDRNAIIFLIVYLASLYQRPYVLNAFALVIFYGGLYYSKVNVIYNNSHSLNAVIIE